MSDLGLILVQETPTVVVSETLSVIVSGSQGPEGPPRVSNFVSVTPVAEPAIDIDTLGDRGIASIVGLNTDVTSMSANFTGTPLNGLIFMVQITDDGTMRNINWGSLFEDAEANLPTVTTPGIMGRILLQWNQPVGKFDCIAV